MSATPLHAAFITTQFTGDANQALYLVPDSEQAVGEARYGNGAGNGDWELGVGIDTQQIGQFDQAQKVWSNGGSESFSLDYDGTNLSLEVGTTNVSYNVGALTADDLFIRVASSVGNSGTLENLVLNGMSLPDVVSPDGTGDASWLVVFDGWVSPFELTGDLTFAWSNPSSLRGSRPSVQFKIATAVPEPSTLALAALGMLGLVAWGFTRR
ncbi:MAG: PEP-CTERM sorting domain-containing protein [Planctomycetota bacterium]|nr:MAG: PEP-CTERM sorting domain-containing protein [Planctomycetota bacterium]